MDKWKEGVTPLTLKGQISVPYNWAVGETGSKFLVSIRDKKKILGAKCSECDTTYVPPRKNCGRCFVDIDGTVEVSNEGTVEACTVVHYSHPVQPIEPPFAYALIKLDGSDVGFLHIIKKRVDSVAPRVRVKAKFKDDRTGSILDIDSFELI
jgi:uncharacterized OB-fold protein